MELVGRSVNKRFPGFGEFSGVVASYDHSQGYFKVVYEDGDSEEMEYGEIAALLTNMGEKAPPGVKPARRSNRGRRPKKKRQSEMDPRSHGQDDDLGGAGGKILETDFLKQSGGEEKKDRISKECDGVLSGVLKEDCDFPISNEVTENVGCLDEVTIDGNPQVGKLENAQFDVWRSEYQGYEEKDEQGTRKRQRLWAKLSSSTELPLRRSSRKASAVMSSSSYCDLDKSNVTIGTENSESVPVGSNPDLPPSSKDLDLDGLPILDFFSVYTFLRSFSRKLFLSPFSLDNFLAAIRCKFVNSLIDSIHFSILQTLKQHMELLSEGGSQLAADCLRNLNWELMDLVTWPVYLAEYLLVYGPQMKSTLEFEQLKLLDMEYYKQPANVKLEILRCLLDNVVEVEIVRVEISTRKSQSDLSMDVYNNVNMKVNDMEMLDVGDSLTQEGHEETLDWNSDECCLCNMDGCLICCDGCPAAFHSRCVGVAKDLLPEGGWYCPECLMARLDGLVKLSNYPQGAEILGTDPHGFQYFSCCGYLLVSDSYGTIASSKFYNVDDLDGVIRVMQSSYSCYDTVLHAISTFWGKSLDSLESHCQLDIIDSTCKEGVVDAQVLSKNSIPSDGSGHNVLTIKPEHDLAFSEDREAKNISFKEICQDDVKPDGPSEKISFSSPRAPYELADTLNSDELPEKNDASSCGNSGNPTNKPVSLAIQNKRCFGVAGQGNTALIAKRRKDGTCQQKVDPGSYANNYSFGRIASSLSKSLMHGSSEFSFDGSKGSDEDIISAQVKVITSETVDYSDLKLPLEVQKEKCGWCHACKSSSDECIFVIADVKHLESYKLQTAAGHRSEKKKKSHIIPAMHYILSIEGGLRGLLYGKWENTQHSNLWRKAVLKASDVSALKHLLLMLESNLRRVALSSEWMKPVDYAQKVGSSSNGLSRPVEVISACGSNRNLGKKMFSTARSSRCQAAMKTDIWWRGGRLSRQLFSWKVLPHSLAFKGGRQAGCKRISNLVYPDSSDSARRSKCIAWRAAVEMAKTVAQLILQIKELDANIKWSELSKTRYFSLKLAKEPKADKLFKKAIIRRKAVQGLDVRYLLDFGKREKIPPSVIRHGEVFVEPSSERKKFWLSEIHVPLYLIKAYEEQKIARSEKKTPSKLCNEKLSIYNGKKLKRSKGLSYLFVKAEKLEIECCSHCNRDVLLREAVNCQLCNGFFHRKHFRSQKGAITYTCNGCKAKTSLKLKNQTPVTKKKKKANDKNTKAVQKKKKCVGVESKKMPLLKDKRNKSKSQKSYSKKNKNMAISRKRKRTVVKNSFWLNGFQRTGKPDDERANNFRKVNILLPSQKSESSSLKPVCSLCTQEYNSDFIYIRCETCKDWFHGEVYHLSLKDINDVIGFKCHKCRSQSVPTCPCSQNIATSNLQLSRECTIGEIFTAECQRIKAKHQNEKTDGCPDSSNYSQQKDVNILCNSSDIELNCETILKHDFPGVKSYESDNNQVQFPGHDDENQMLINSDKMEEDVKDMISVSESTGNHSYLHLMLDDDSTSHKDKMVFNAETLTANGSVSIQTFEPADEKAESPRHEHVIQTLFSEKIEQLVKDNIRVSDSLIPGSSNPSAELHSNLAVSASKVVDSEDKSQMLRNSDKMEEDVKDMISVSESTYNHSYLHLMLDDDSTSYKDKMLFNAETLAANGSVSIQTFEPADEKAESPRHEHVIQTLFSEKIEQLVKDNIRVSDSLIPGSSIPSAELHSILALSASKVVDSEDKSQMLMNSDKMEEDVKDMISVSESTDNHSYLHLMLDDDSTSYKDKMVFNSETLAANGSVSIQTFEPADEKAESPRHEDVIQTLFTEEIEQHVKDNIGVSDSLIPGSSNPSSELHSNLAVSASKVVDSEDKSTLIVSESLSTP